MVQWKSSTVLRCNHHLRWYFVSLLHDNTLYTNLAQKQDVGQGLRHKSPSTSETSGLPNLIFEDVECKWTVDAGKKFWVISRPGLGEFCHLFISKGTFHGRGSAGPLPVRDEPARVSPVEFSGSGSDRLGQRNLLWRRTSGLRHHRAGFKFRAEVEVEVVVCETLRETYSTEAAAASGGQQTLLIKIVR